MTKGFYWHVHHDILLEWCYDVEKRIDYIKKHKPADEIETRLKWMTAVQGELPEEVVEAWEARDKAWVAYDKTRKAYYKTRKAYDKALEKHKDELEALHAKERPGCPWNGRALVFPESPRR